MSVTGRTYQVEVPDVGAFTFRKRVIRDQIRIEAEALRILGGETESDGLRHIATAMATLVVLTVQAPDKWDVEALDPLDPEAANRLWQVYGELRSSEERFRAGTKA